jgi:hypothetical protein
VLVRGGGERELEIVVLRHQLAILGRGGKRPRYTTVDRALLAAASRLLPSERWSCFALSPRTLRRWHRILLEGGWRGRRRRPGRPPLAAEKRGLICRLARENPRWGYMRIQGELLKLGISISTTTIATVLRASGLGPAPRRIGPSWSEFLRAQAQSMLGGELRSRMGGGLEGDIAEPSGLPEDGEAREAEADRDKLPSALPAEPRVASHPLPVRSRSARPRQRVLPPPRAPLRLPPTHRSHARDGPQGAVLVPLPMLGARSKPSPVARPASGPTTRVGSLPDASSSALRHRRTAPTRPRSCQPEPSFFTPQDPRRRRRPPRSDGNEQTSPPCAFRSASTVARVGEAVDDYVDAVQASARARPPRAERDRGIAARMGVHLDFRGRRRGFRGFLSDCH